MIYNGETTMLYGCVPLDDNGEFKSVTIGDSAIYGKVFLDYCEKRLRDAYRKKEILKQKVYTK